jgi:hypothetical protein
MTNHNQKYAQNGLKQDDFDIKPDFTGRKKEVGALGEVYQVMKECKVYVYLYINTYTLHPC